MSDFAAASDQISAGVMFNLTYGVGVPLNQVDNVVKSANRASSAWSRYLKDNVALSTQIEFVDLPDGIIGGARPAMVKVNYKDLVTALFNDRSSSQDWTVLNHLQLDAKDRQILQSYANESADPSKVKFGTQAFALYLDSQFGSSGGSFFLDENGNSNNQKIWLTRANAKALDLIKTDDHKLDAIIQLNRSTRWDFDSSDGITPGHYDFTSVLTHELGHVLGVVSGVDAFEFLTVTQNQTLSDKDLTYVSPMDLFRYSTASAQRGVMDLRMGDGIEKFFSIDGGKTRLANFATGGTNVGGDGYQSSHWQPAAQPLGIMAPNLQPGQSLAISSLDLQLLDAIGWNLQSPLAVKAAAAGVNWNQLGQQLNQHQQALIDRLATSWAAKNPGYSIESDLQAEARQLTFKLNRDIEQEFDRLIKKSGALKDASQRTKEIQTTINKIWGWQDSQDKALTQFTKDRDQLDGQVRAWLDLNPKELADRLNTAAGVEIIKLSELINRANGSQRIIWEASLMNAFSYITDNPSKAVQDVLKSSGPGNPIGWRPRFWGWTQVGTEEANLDLLIR